MSVQGARCQLKVRVTAFLTIDVLKHAGTTVRDQIEVEPARRRPQPFAPESRSLFRPRC
jgi:hypothetical protein